MLHAGGTQCSLGGADCGADFSKTKRPVRICLEEILESHDDRIVT